MSEFKYIVVKVERFEKNLAIHMPFIFPKELIHADMFKCVCKSINSAYAEINERVHCKVVGAGFFNSILCKCYGESETLKVKSRVKEDTELIKSYSYTMGIES